MITLRPGDPQFMTIDPRSFYEQVLVGQIGADITLEEIVDRALVHLFHGADFNDSVSLLGSDTVVERMYDFLMERFNDPTVLKEESIELKPAPPELLDSDLDQAVATVVKGFDGFHHGGLLSRQFLLLIKSLPYRKTFEALERSRAVICEKLKTLLVFILEKKRRYNNRSGINQFVYEYGQEEDILALERDLQERRVIVEEILLRLNGDIEMVKCGSGNRFDCFRLRVRSDRTGIEWDYTSLVQKIMREKKKRGRPMSPSANRGRYKGFEREHEMVYSHFGPEYVADTIFHDANEQRVRALAESKARTRFFVTQEFVKGDSIAQACRDPFLADSLAQILPGYIELYEGMMTEHRRTIDAQSIAKQNVLVRRTLRPRIDDGSSLEDELKIVIVDTNNLFVVGSRKYGNMMLDAKTGEDHYLRRLHSLVENGGHLV